MAIKSQQQLKGIIPHLARQRQLKSGFWRYSGDGDPGARAPAASKAWRRPKERSTLLGNRRSHRPSGSLHRAVQHARAGMLCSSGYHLPTDLPTDWKKPVGRLPTTTSTTIMHTHTHTRTHTTKWRCLIVSLGPGVKLFLEETVVVVGSICCWEAFFWFLMRWRSSKIRAEAAKVFSWPRIFIWAFVGERERERAPAPTRNWSSPSRAPTFGCALRYVQQETDGKAVRERGGCSIRACV